MKFIAFIATFLIITIVFFSGYVIGKITGYNMGYEDGEKARKVRYKK